MSASSQMHGPALPPGFARPQPTTRDAGGFSSGRGTAHDKLRSGFRCPKFLGEARNWKVWNKGFTRFLAIQNLDHVIAETFMGQPLTVSQQEENKLVYYIIEDAVSGSAVATQHVRRAAEWNGWEAYNLLYNGYAFSGPATATLLLNELNNFRFLVDESASKLCLRLQEIFEDLAAVPGDSSIEFSDTQKINYLLTAIRHERSLSSVYALIQTDQLRGRVTFDQACDDLRYRCESLRADEMLNTSGRQPKVRNLIAATDPAPAVATTAHALITSSAKRQNGENAPRPAKEPVQCLATGCDTLTPPHLRLCRLHYHECIAGKHPSLPLKTGDQASYDVATNKIVFPHLANGLKPKTGRKSGVITKGTVRSFVATNLPSDASN